MDPDVVVAVPTRTEINEAFKVVTDRIRMVMHGRLMESVIPKEQQEELYKQLLNCDTTDSAIAGVMKICDLIAKASISRHLAIIACDATSLRAFCPSCGRHYRYHNKVTGECPKNPFEGAQENSDRAA